MKLLPMFPLEIVVFPKESLNLHIFEPRYRELIQDCRTHHIHFGIPYYRPNHPLQFGTIVQLDSISRTYADGRLDIKTRGIMPFEIMRFVKTHPGKSYPGGYIKELNFDTEGDPFCRLTIRDKLEELYHFMNIAKWPKVLDSEFLTFEIGHKVGLAKEQEYELLQIPGELDRQKYIIEHLERMIPMIKQAEEMRQKIQMNGHFKDLKAPDV